MNFTTEEMKGKNVIDSHGRELGQVDDISFDPERWKVSGLVVGLHKEVAEDLNLDTGRFARSRLEVSPERIQALGDNVILNLGTQDLAGLLRGDEGRGSYGVNYNEREGR